MGVSPGFGTPVQAGYGPFGHQMTKKQRKAYARAMQDPYGMGGGAGGSGFNTGAFGGGGGGFGNNNNNNGGGGNLNQRMNQMCNYLEWKAAHEQHEAAEKARQAELEKERAEETARWIAFSGSMWRA